MAGGDEQSGAVAEVAVEKRVDITPAWLPIEYRVTETSRNVDREAGWFGWTVTLGLTALAGYGLWVAWGGGLWPFLAMVFGATLAADGLSRRYSRAIGLLGWLVLFAAFGVFSFFSVV